ncbi:MAG: hypothetical protein MK081_07130 [Flavobacteriales bacterium]|nr:hypothetical protein [Flavobacteriales bacterium]
MKSLSTYLIALLAVLLAPLAVQGQFYTGSQQEFGKNRVQYRDFFWQYYPGENFEVYYYQGGKELAGYTVLSAQQNLEYLETLFDFALEEKIQIILYNKQSEFRQSNIGITGEESYNIGGSTRIIGSKIFLYFKGDYIQFERQLRESLALVMFNQMMFSGDWKDVIKNSTLLTIPAWYQDGLLSYAAEPWSADKAAYIRDGILSGSYEKFNRLEGDQATYAGHALWKYISDVYGESVIPNILYMTRISRSIESGFLFVLGTSLDTITEEFLAYYQQQFEQDIRRKSGPQFDPLFSKKQNKLKDEFMLSDRDGQQLFKEEKWKRRIGELPVKWRGKYTYSELELSPNGQQVAFVTNELGQYKIWIYDKTTGKKKRILKQDHKLDRIVDDTYPILAWHPSGQILTYVFEDRGRPFIGNYNTIDKKHTVKELFRIDKVVDMSYSPDGRKMIFTGVKGGRSDLYLYQVIGNNQEQLTTDIYDDLNPQFLADGNRVIFASNRPDDTLRVDVPNEPFELQTDIYIFDLNSRKLERVTNSPDIYETHPYAFDDEHYTFLGEDAGARNRYMASIDSVISRIDTVIHYRFFTVSKQLSDFPNPPVDYQFDHKTGNWQLSFVEDGKLAYYEGNGAQEVTSSAQSSGTTATPDAPSSNHADVQVFEYRDQKDQQVDIDNYKFEDDPTDFEYEKESIQLDENTAVAENASAEDSLETPFVLPKPRNYRLNFATDYVLSQVDNTFSNQFYQPFTGPTTMFPGISGVIRLGVSDLFEDYKIVGGFRLSGGLDNNDYGLSFEDLSGRIDKRYEFMRQSTRRVINNLSIVQVHTHTFEYELKYPINELTSIRATAIYRQDRSVYLSTDPTNLDRPNEFLHNVGVRGEYVFDNTISRGLNLRWGTRYKLWAEAYLDAEDRVSDFMVFGADFRHYERIHRDMIFAFRAAGSTSIGARRLVYYLGGVDNWLFQRIDDDTPIADDQNYFYQTLAAPMRGFWVNARNGNSFAGINAEVRWPVFKYFLNKPIKSDFVENFQFVPFTDVGSAWTGLHPYSDDNRFNQVVYEQNPITVTVDNNREPIIWSYGFGFRSRVLGYFVRADWAWGVDDGMIQDRVFHLSLSMDF